MSSAVDTLAKIDLYCQWEGAIRPEFLMRLARARGLPEGEDLAILRAKLRLEKAEQLPDLQAYVRQLFQSEQDVEDAARDLAETLIAETVVHVEIFVDPTAWSHLNLDPVQLFEAMDRGLMGAVTEVDDVFLSWVFVPVLRRDLSEGDATALVTALIAGEIERLRGIAVSDQGEATQNAAHLKAALDVARQASLGIVVCGGDFAGQASVAEALALGASRLVGAVAALKDANLVLQLRAHRTPVVVLPSWQLLTGAARTMASHPLRKFKEAGIFTVIGSGWPQWLGTSMTGELEQMALHHHWRLDDMRNASSRAIEAAFMEPNLRFHLSRRIEVWRHRPLAGPPNKSDNWSL